MNPLSTDRLMAESAAPGRECGACTVCCTVLAEKELRKPMRCACDHVHSNGCGIYATRPSGCREFHCLWLRGALPSGEAFRPDHLGVLFDGYRPTGSNEDRLVALEVWNDAFDGPAARALINGVAAEHRLELSRRDGAWQTRGPADIMSSTEAHESFDHPSTTESTGSSSGTRDSTGTAARS
jgi:hypothetical protein